MILYLIRHGETALNAARVVQPPDTPLSARGQLQARRLAARLADQRIGRIVSSDLARALMTAQALRAVCDAPLELEPLLQERNFGELRGRTYAELGFDLFAPDLDPPGGETWQRFDARVDRAWSRLERIAAGTEGALAVVSHGLVCRALAARHLGRAEAAVRELPQRWANASLTVAEGPAPWRLRLVNCTAHLDGDAADAGDEAAGF